MLISSFRTPALQLEFWIKAWTYFHIRCFFFFQTKAAENWSLVLQLANTVGSRFATSPNSIWHYRHNYINKCTKLVTQTSKCSALLPLTGGGEIPSITLKCHPRHVTGLEGKGLVCLNVPLRKGTSGCGSTEARQQQRFSTCSQQLGHNEKGALQKGSGTIPIGTTGVLFELPLTTDIPKPRCVVQPQHHPSKRGGNQPRWTLKSHTYSR